MENWIAEIFGVKYAEALNVVVWNGNTILDLAEAFLIFLLLVLSFHLIVTRLVNRFDKFARNSHNDLDNKIADVLDKLKGPLAYFFSLYVALQWIKMPSDLDMYVRAFFWFVFFYYGITAIKIMSDSLLDLVMSKKKKDAEVNKTVKFGLRMGINIVLWAGGLLVILSSLGVNISGLVASLGIGGVVVALSVQNILGDLLSSVMLYFDRPFEVGDYIVLGEESGIVKRIGMKTTRIETLKGDELVIPNSKIAADKVHNYKKMKRRRISFEFGVEYDTTVAQLKKTKKIVSDLINQNKNLELFAVHFTSFGDFSLVFQVIYYVNDPAYLIYLEEQESLNLKIKAELNKIGVGMAFPTQTLYVKKVK